MFDHWNQHALQWQWMAPPLRPATEDIGIAERALRDWRTGMHTPAFDAVLLGVTPELALMEWPAGTRLLAVDRAQAMIDTVWPQPALPADWHAHCGAWSALPMADASQHVVVGDGCFVLLTWPEPWQAVAREVRRVLHGDGVFVIRFFVRPEAQETSAQVFADLHEGRIGNFHILKWRLAMALHGSFEEGVRLADIWDAWQQEVPDPQALARRLAWPMESVRTMDAYRDVDTRYAFPTLAEARTALAPWFDETACIIPEYELGKRCPTLVLKPRAITNEF